MSVDDYIDIETVNVEHTEYKAGQEYPELCSGRLWLVSPGNIVKITGQGFAKATKYVQKKLRCGLCGHVADGIDVKHHTIFFKENVFQTDIWMCDDCI